MHLPSASPRGGTPGWCGDFANCAFQSSCISPPVGAFLLAKSPLFGEAKHPTGFEDALQNFILGLWTVSKHSDFAFWWKLNLNYFFLNTTYLNSKVIFFIQTRYHRTTTYTLAQLKGTIDRYSSKTVVLWNQNNWERRSKLIKAVD